MSLARQAAILICAAIPLLAAPKLTTIQDTLYKADGSRFNGSAVISWMPFDTSDNSKIGLQSLTVQITNGAFRVQLVPNADATPANYYTVQYSSDGKQQFTESWSVPSSTTTLRIKDVRVATASTSTGGTSSGGVVQPPSQTPINESSVVGLLTDLSVRPVRGANYTTGRAAVVNDGGALDSATGNLSDCVRVDGSSGPCFDSTLVPAFVDSETPGGALDGVNATFTLAYPPNPSTSLALFRNGIAQQQGADYTIQTDGSLLFAAASVPQVGDTLLANYRVGGATSDVMVQPQTQSALNVQVLCNGSGAGTSGASLAILGVCSIPARTLAIGDRVEVRFTFAHAGTTKGFNYEVHWGDATMVMRTATTRDTLVTGRGDATIGPAGTTLDVQTWGTSLSLDSRLAMTTDVLSQDIPVSFLAALTAAGTDTISLQNYTVLRYPAQ
jgi:hypothetical protein